MPIWTGRKSPGDGRSTTPADAPQGAPPDEARAPPASGQGEPARGTLLGDLNAVADSWFGQRWFDGRKPSAGATPEELVAAAGERGIQVSFAQRKLASLNKGDFPCVIMDKDGASTILTGRPSRDAFTCRTAGVDRQASLAELDAQHSGVVFFVSPQRDPSVTDPASPAEMQPPERHVSLLRMVVDEMRQRHRGRLLQVCVAALVSNLLLLAVPVFSQAVYDRVIPHLAWETLWALAIGVCIALAFDLALRIVRLKLSDAVGLSVSAAVQARLYARILRAKLDEAPRMAGGVQTGLREIEALAQLLPALLVSVLVDVPFFVLAMALLAAIAGPVAWIPLVALLPIYAMQLMGDARGQRALEAARLMATQANLLLESVAGLETVKITDAAGPLTRRWERLVDAAAYVGHLNRLHGAAAGIVAMTVSQAAVVVGLVVGVYQIGESAMTMGALTASTMLIGRMISPVSAIGSTVHRLMQILRSTKTVEDALKATQESAGDPTAGARPILGALAFKDVHFTYPGEQVAALKGVSLTIAPGEKVGFVGRAGSGKSTLLKLMLRLHDATEGAVLLDGHDIRQASPGALRRHFGFMRQDSALFDDMLRNAVCFGLDHVEPEAFEKAVTLSGVAEFAARHPAGYGMRIGPRGERLSGGERQSVMLARTLLGGPKALVLDEPTAAMDNTMEIRIVRDLRAAIGDRTLILSTHRAPMLQLVDRLVWMDGGRIMADGPKDEVLKAIAGASAA